jgi:hypothetical protein
MCGAGIAFINIMKPILPSPEATEDGASRCPLEFYRNLILPLDIGFAIVVSAFIICTAVVIAKWLGNSFWIVRVCFSRASASSTGRRT